MKIFKGFTLAEVLITVGIIGVIASLTIPVLNSSISNKQKIAQFKTIYSKIQTSLEKIAINGKIYRCYNSPEDNMIEQYGLQYSLKGGVLSFESEDCSKFWKKFPEYMGVARTCEDDDVEKCIGASYARNLDLSNSCEGFFKGFHRVYILENGMYIIQDGMGEEMFAIDINGKKAPNKWGEDIFPFDIVVVASNKIGSKVYATKVSALPVNCDEGEYTDRMLKEITGR